MPTRSSGTCLLSFINIHGQTLAVERGWRRQWEGYLRFTVVIAIAAAAAGAHCQRRRTGDPSVRQDTVIVGEASGEATGQLAVGGWPQLSSTASATHGICTKPTTKNGRYPLSHQWNRITKSIMPLPSSALCYLWYQYHRPQHLNHSPLILVRYPWLCSLLVQVLLLTAISLLSC